MQTVERNILSASSCYSSYGAVTQEEMLKAITNFGDELERGGIGLFYYAGHGVRLRREYYSCVDAEIQREGGIRTRP